MDHSEVAILTHRISVVALSPEVPAPEFLLNYGMCFKDVTRSDTFDFLD
jgi:hypothetical protein